MTDTDALCELFNEIHDRLNGVRTLVSRLDDPDAMALVEEMEFGVLAPMRRLRVHLRVPYNWTDYPPSR